MLHLLPIIRIALSGTTLTLILRHQERWALLAFLIAVAVEHAEGLCAKRNQFAGQLADKTLLLCVLSAMLVRELCPSWFLGLTFTIAAFQLAGLTLFRILRPLSSVDLTPLPASRVSHLLSLLWVAFVLIEASIDATYSSFYLKHFAYAMLGAINIVAFFQTAQKWSSRILPFAVFLRQRA